MRYIMAEKDGNMIVAIWSKSQNLEYTTNPVCSHRDYLRAKDISFDDAVSIGDVHVDTATHQIKIEPLPWDGTKAAAPDRVLLTQKTQEFLTQYQSSLKSEIDKDWDKYQEHLERQRLAAQKYGYSR